MTDRPRTVDEPLERLLENVHAGRIRVPEFQRGLVLPDDWVRSLLASVSLGYPIGAVMLLRAGSPDLRFESRPVGRAPAAPEQPEWLLLDGQRRVSALYQALASGHPVRDDDDGGPGGRWYYLDVDASLDPRVDRDDAIVRVLEPRGADANDGPMAEADRDGGLFPLRLVFGAERERRSWQRGFARDRAAVDTEERARTMDRFDTEVLDAFRTYRVLLILHGPETTRWSVRVHGGPEGRSLSDRFSIRRGDPPTT